MELPRYPNQVRKCEVQDGNSAPAYIGFSYTKWRYKTALTTYVTLAGK
jgi:hypothetical protein